MADRSTIMEYSKFIITFCLLILIKASALFGQSDFYKSVSSSAESFSLLPEEESLPSFPLHLGNIQEENFISNYNFHTIDLVSVVNGPQRVNSLSALLNKHSKIKSLRLPSRDQEKDTKTLLKLDYENLKFIEHITVEWNENIDYNSFWGKLVQASNLKYLTIKGDHNTGLKVTPNFISLTSKLSGLQLSNISILPSTQRLSSKNLTTLIIKNHSSSSESIKYLLESFSACQNISEIIFDRSSPMDFNVLEYLNQYKKLKVLDLDLKSYSTDNKPFESIAQLPNIESLHIKNGTHCSHKGIHKFKSLRKLDFVHRNLKVELDDDVYKLENLEVLAYDSKTIDSRISNLKKLKKLRIRGSFSSFPSQFYTLKKLTHLDVECRSLDTLFRQIDAFKNLEALILKSPKIKEVPQAITSLTNLKHIAIDSYRGVESIPNDIGNLKNLEVFKLKSSYLKTLPTSFTKLDKLKTLEIQGSEDAAIESYNGITFIKRDTFYQNLLTSIPLFVHLQSLNLSYNKFTEEKLRRLLTKIQPDVLQNLSLNLSHCWIESLPEHIWEGLQIKHLNLSNNEIKEIPDSFLKSNIEQFDLSSNSYEIDFSYQDRMWMYITGLRKKKLTPNDIKDKTQFINFLAALLVVEPYNYYYANLAFEVDSAYAAQALTPSALATYYFSQKDFKRASELYELERHSFMNSYNPDMNYAFYQISNDWFRYVLSLHALAKSVEFEKEVKEMYLHSNASLEIYKSKCECQALKLFRGNDRIQLGILLNAIDKESATKIWEPKITQMEKLTKTENCNPGNFLNLLELYLTTENYESFDSLYIHTLINVPKDANYEIILEYLKIAKDVILGLDRTASIEKLKRTLEQRVPIRTKWDASYIEMWAILSNNPNASHIQELNRIIQPSLSYIPIPTN